MVRMPGQGAEQRAGFQPRKDYQPQVTSQELGVMVGNSLNTLLEAIQSGNTERLTQYLAFSSRFHRYSRRNQQLIFSQCPEATRVASYVKWKEEGYHVRKMDEEHGIRILVPKFPKFYKKPDRRQPESQEGAKPEEKREDEYKVQEVDFITRSFKVGTVFDVTHLMFLLIQVGTTGLIFD